MIRSCRPPHSVHPRSPAIRTSRSSSLRTAAIALIWSGRPQGTTGTGRSAKSCDLRKRSDQLARELRPLPGFFVLEVHVDVAALRCALLDHSRPPLDIRRAIPFVPQAEVRVIRGHFHGYGELLAVGHAQRQVARAQAIVDFLV